MRARIPCRTAREANSASPDDFEGGSPLGDQIALYRLPVQIDPPAGCPPRNAGGVAAKRIAVEAVHEPHLRGSVARRSAWTGSTTESQREAPRPRTGVLRAFCRKRPRIAARVAVLYPSNCRAVPIKLPGVARTRAASAGLRKGAGHPVRLRDTVDYHSSCPIRR